MHIKFTFSFICAAEILLVCIAWHFIFLAVSFDEWKFCILVLVCSIYNYIPFGSYENSLYYLYKFYYLLSPSDLYSTWNSFFVYGVKWRPRFISFFSRANWCFFSSAFYVTLVIIIVCIQIWVSCFYVIPVI
jgi:hypothetical protein